MGAQARARNQAPEEGDAVVRIDAQSGGIVAGGAWVPLLSAEVHYFRHDPRDWGAILDAVRDARLPIVSSLVLWNVHEHSPGRFDFKGETDPKRNLLGFLEAARERGLFVTLRLGPACCEWREGGASSFGTPWRTAVEALWGAVGPLRAPQGPVLLLEIANEWLEVLAGCGSGSGGPGGFEVDPGIVIDALRETYRSIKALNGAWGTRLDSFDDVASIWTGERTPGRIIESTGMHLRDRDPGGSVQVPVMDLLEAFRNYAALAIRKDVETLRSAAGLPIMHHGAVGNGDSFARRARADLCGHDVYGPTTVPIWDWLYPAAELQGDELPFSAELGCGTLDRHVLGGQGRYAPAFLRLSILSLVARGLRAFNLYMFADRDNWRGSPVDRRGGRRSSFDALRRVVIVLREAEFARWERVADLVVVKHVPYHLGEGDAPEAGFRCLYRSLCGLEYEFTVQKVAEEKLRNDGTRAVVVHALSFMAAPLARRLADFASSGGVVILYPEVPAQDLRSRALEAFAGLSRPVGSGVSARFHLGEHGVTCETAAPVRTFSVPQGADSLILDGEGRCVGYRSPQGRGHIGVVGADVGAVPSLLDLVLRSWTRCRRIAATNASDSGATLFRGPEGAHYMVIYNGHVTDPVTEVCLHQDLAGEIDGDVAEDLLGGKAAVIERLPGGDGDPGARISCRVPPRDAAVIRFGSGAPPAMDTRVEGGAEPERSEIPSWEIWEEPFSGRIRAFSGPEMGEEWFEAPLGDWTLAALASGKTLGVQGWFWLKQWVFVPSAAERCELRLAPRGRGDLGFVLVNGVEVGGFAWDRPGGEIRFDILPYVVEGAENIVAIRLYRQALDRHDRAPSGFDQALVAGDGYREAIETWNVAQEFWEPWPAEEAAWRPVTLPLRWAFRRDRDALWMRAALPGGDAGSLEVRGDNLELVIFRGDRYVVTTPYLPAVIPMGEGAAEVLLRATPDPLEADTAPPGERNRIFLRDAADLLEVSIDHAAWTKG